MQLQSGKYFSGVNTVNLVILPGRIEPVFTTYSGPDTQFTLKKGTKERKKRRFLQNEPFLASKSAHSFRQNAGRISVLENIESGRQFS